MINALANQIKLRAHGVSGAEAKVRVGIVDGYDPSHFAVKVRIQPEDILTGWMPLTSPWVGNQWGMYAAPSLGDQVEVHFQQNGSNAGFVVQRFFSNLVKPLAVPSGQFWLVDSEGSYIKLINDGSIASKGIWNHQGPLNVSGGDVTVDGNVFASEDITDQTGSSNETMREMRTRYNSHVHLPGNITPTPQM